VQNGFRALTTENILEASRVLFDGKVVFTNGLQLDLIKPEYALACLAHAYAESGRNPPGMAYNMLKLIHRPRKAYAATPMMYLPDEFREIFGMAVYACPWECGQTFMRKAELEAHAAAVHQEEGEPDPDPKPEPAAVNESTDPAVLGLWRRTLDALQAEMPQASFDTWVKESFAVSLENDHLTIAARNAFVRDWLSSRLMERASKIAGVRVEFVNA
jgi:hypothetical protein